MPLFKREIDEHQSEFDILRADTDKLSDETPDLINDVFTASFMDKYTVYDSVDKFIEDSPADLTDSRSFASSQFERFVEKNTVFDDWEEMKARAAENWIVSELDI